MVAEWLIAVEALKVRHGIDEAIVHVHLPSWAPLAWALRSTFGWPVVYDCMDEWEDFPRVGRAFVEPERELVAGADLVVTTAEKLRAKCAPSNSRTLLVRNGVDADFFTDNCAPSNVLSDVPHPIIGFTGTLAEWVDFELLATVARERPDWTFVLVGYVHVGVDGLFGLERLPNVILTGLQPYQMMPSFLFWFDVAIIPFVNDNISAAVDPVKFYEYAASGKRIVTTDLPELAEHSHLFHSGIGATGVEQAIEKALAEGPKLAQARVELAHANTWESRYQTLDSATRALWPTLSIVIVTYGQLAFTRRCLDTLIANTTYPALEVIVVDNGSTDGTALYLQHLAVAHPRIKLILNSHNRGFAPANNQRLAIATGDVLVLLNNDTELSPGWHVPLLKHLEDHTIGLVGPRSDSVGNEAIIRVPDEYAGDLDGFCRMLQREHEGKTFDIEMLGMFCVAMRRDVYEAVGPLDEGYEIGMFEDDDYAQRIRAAGWRVTCARDAFVHHVGNATFKSLIASGEYERLWNRNRALYEARWGPWRPGGEVIEGHD